MSYETFLQHLLKLNLKFLELCRGHLIRSFEIGAVPGDKSIKNSTSLSRGLPDKSSRNTSRHSLTIGRSSRFGLPTSSLTNEEGHPTLPLCNSLFENNQLWRDKPQANPSLRWHQSPSNLKGLGLLVVIYALHQLYNLNLWHLCPRIQLLVSLLSTQHLRMQAQPLQGYPFYATNECLEPELNKHLAEVPKTEIVMARFKNKPKQTQEPII